MRLTSDDSQGRLYLELVFLDGIDFLRSCMWLLNASQFWWMFLVPWDARKSEQKVRDFSFSMSQFTLDQMGKVLDGFLLTCARRAMSARIMPSWSEMPGMACILFTRLGLLCRTDRGISITAGTGRAGDVLWPAGSGGTCDWATGCRWVKGRCGWRHTRQEDAVVAWDTS